MANDIGDILNALVPKLQAISGIVTVKKYVPLVPLTDAQVPALFCEVFPSVTSSNKTTTRRIHWPIDIWISVGVRDATIDTDFDLIYPLPRKVIDALDAAGSFDGLLATTVQYGEPMVSHPEQGTAFGTTRWQDKQYVETAVHAIFTVDRVGGFGNG